MAEPKVLKHGDPGHVPLESYAKLFRAVEQSENVAELPLNEDDMSMLWYLLVSASMELDDEVDEADHYEFLIEHIDRDDVMDLLRRIQDLEGLTYLTKCHRQMASGA